MCPLTDVRGRVGVSVNNTGSRVCGPVTGSRVCGLLTDTGSRVCEPTNRYRK